MKKILLTTAVLGLCTAAVEARTHGFFIGLGLAAVGQESNAAISYQPLVAIPNAPPIALGGGATYFQGASYDKPNLNRQSAQVDFMLGYAALFERWYLAAVLNYIVPSPSISSSSSSAGFAPFIYRVGSSKGTWGLAVRFGRQFCDKFIGYVRLGMEQRKFSLYFDAGDGFPSINASSTKSAITPGIGVEYFVVEQVAFGVEYRHAFYRSINLSSFNATDQNVNFWMKPRIGTAMVTVRYQF